MLLFEAGTLARAELERRISEADDPYLRTFLLKTRMKSEKILTGFNPMKARCIQKGGARLSQRMRGPRAAAA